MINPHIRNFYIYLFLGYLAYIPIFFIICSKGWIFVLACLIFSRIWSSYLANYYLSQAEKEIKRLEETIMKAFKGAEAEYEEQEDKKKEKLDVLQKQSEETDEIVRRLKENSKKKAKD